MSNKTIKKLIYLLSVIVLVGYFYYNHVHNPYVYIAKNGTKYRTTDSPYYQAYPRIYSNTVERSTKITL